MARDAKGQKLDSHIELENGRLSLVVKDEGAEYPLRVDRGNFGKISTYFRLFGKILKRSRVIFALVRDADLESQIETPNAGLIIGNGRDRFNENHVGEPVWSEANRFSPSMSAS